MKWGQEVNADEFEEVSLVHPQHHPIGATSHQQGYYTQDSLLNRRAKSGGGRFAGMVLNIYDLTLITAV